MIMPSSAMARGGTIRTNLVRVTSSLKPARSRQKRSGGAKCRYANRVVIASGAISLHLRHIRTRLPRCPAMTVLLEDQVAKMQVDTEADDPAAINEGLDVVEIDKGPVHGFGDGADFPEVVVKSLGPHRPRTRDQQLSPQANRRTDMGRRHRGGIEAGAVRRAEELRSVQPAIHQTAGGIDQQIVDRHADAQPSAAEPIDRLVRGERAVGTGREADQRDWAADLLRAADVAALQIGFDPDDQRCAGSQIEVAQV